MSHEVAETALNWAKSCGYARFRVVRANLGHLLTRTAIATWFNIGLGLCAPNYVVPVGSDTMLFYIVYTSYKIARDSFMSMLFRLFLENFSSNPWWDLWYMSGTNWELLSFSTAFLVFALPSVCPSCSWSLSKSRTFLVFYILMYFGSLLFSVYHITRCLACCICCIS